MKDVARAAGVSVSSVSLALRNDSRISPSVQERVRREANRLGYRFNLSGALLSQSRPKLLGVVAHFDQELHTAYVREIADLASGSGYRIIAENAALYDDPATALEKLAQLRVANVIAINPPVYNTDEDILPTVVIAQDTDLPQADLVRSDNMQGVTELASHLRQLGHRCVYYLAGPQGVSGDARLEMLASVLKREDIEMYPWQAGNTLSAGFAAMQDLLVRLWRRGRNAEAENFFPARLGALGKTTAIVCYNDQCAMGAYLALLKAGIDVPADVSLVGFDNSAAGASPAFSLTTIDRCPRKVAEAAFSLACARREGRETEIRRVTVPTHLVVRSSTAQANFLHRVGK